MLSTIASSDIRTLVLIPQESKELLELLDQAVQRSVQAGGPNVLLSTRDKLDDADGIAMWLRENVAYEMTSREALTVAEILQEHLAEDQEFSDLTRATLSTVSNKLSQLL